MLTQIREHVYDITCRVRPNGKRNRVFFFTENTPTLVDAGYDDTTDAIIDSIAEIGIEPERLIITHGDRDHIGGFDTLAREYDLETWVPEQTGASFDRYPTHRYDGGTRIDPFVSVHTPGHTSDNHTLVDEDAGIAVMGDAASGSDRRGLPTGYLTLPPNSHDLDVAIESLEKLLDYEFDIALVYHGSSVKQNARKKLDRYVNPL